MVMVKWIFKVGNDAEGKKSAVIMGTSGIKGECVGPSETYNCFCMIMCVLHCMDKI